MKITNPRRSSCRRGKSDRVANEIMMLQYAAEALRQATAVQNHANEAKRDSPRVARPASSDVFEPSGGAEVVDIRVARMALRRFRAGSQGEAVDPGI